ncbi:MAG: protein phosphatase 2C domain-containing protein [Lachnospiraceae bacterium]|nr:protein phosphatase 2C domain-containing protein [Lachnospiraceae bacterium]
MLRKTCARSVQGASHIRSGQPCQDSYMYMEYPDGTTILAVADGHGSKACPFSRTGARVAVNVFCSAIGRLIDSFTGNPDLLMAYLNREGELKVAQEIDREWKARIRRIHAERGRTKTADTGLPDSAETADTGLIGSAETIYRVDDTENSGFSENADTRYSPESRIRKTETNAIFRLYGTTLLGLLLTPQFLFAFQIGDGDIIRIDAKQVTPVIEAEKFLGTQTNSLSATDAWKKAVTVMHRFEGMGTISDSFRLANVPHKVRDAHIHNQRLWTYHAPVLYLLSTDGFSNSHVSDEALEQTCREYYEMIQKYGFDAVAASLKSWLSETSELGCGDDITVALVCLYPEPSDKTEENTSACEEHEVEGVSASEEPAEEEGTSVPGKPAEKGFISISGEDNEE